ncbi:hypothetical protein GKZ68_10480 [Hymenobacter sp. BRD128]|uniref:hypothetical protein n=1 Tax=Hymenobacter sp. BRD128 TaxID=2675878 RepID=UPI0015677C88|nr:hypothetical protein [Hymenobacter sp. BRD128]QKG57015.1 hypothetical protein GKZ68_10480 [Hymenobacter sp. BRD128]
MAHNFRIATTGTGVYLSKAGDDANSGTADAPIKTLSRLATFNQTGSATSVIGTGTYVLPSDWNGRFGTFFADGIVKILGDTQTTAQLIAANGSYVHNVIFDKFAGFGFRPNPYDGDCQYFACIFKVLPDFAGQVNSSATSNTSFFDCILYGVNADLGKSNFSRCLFINCTITVSSVSDSYIDSTSAIAAQSASNNNVDPGCNTAAGRGLNVAGAGWSLTSPSGIHALPLFNSLVKEDYTLRASSPHILTGIGPAQYRYANSFYVEYTGSAADTASLANTHLRATGTNVVVPLLDITTGSEALEVNSQGGLVLQATTTSDGMASLTTGRIPFADVADEMTVMLLKAGLNFDTSYPALESQFNFNQPEIFNNNVPDFSNYAPGTAGRNPNRLSYRMRWSTKLNPNADLANVSDWITGTKFIEFEWNQKPLWNPATGVGNGEAGYDPATGVPIQCTYYQLAISLRNNYYH